MSSLDPQADLLDHRPGGGARLPQRVKRIAMLTAALVFAGLVAVSEPLSGKSRSPEPREPDRLVEQTYEPAPTSAPAILARHDFDLVRYGANDPDAAETLLSLSRDEADTLADILGAPRIVERFADLTREVPGLVSGTLEVTAGSRFDGKPLGATRSRTLTGASIVAVVRGDRVIASPTPAEVLRGGDLLVVVGTTSGLDGVRQILHG